MRAVFNNTIMVLSIGSELVICLPHVFDILVSGCDVDVSHQLRPQLVFWGLAPAQFEVLVVRLKYNV